MNFHYQLEIRNLLVLQVTPSRGSGTLTGESAAPAASAAAATAEHRFGFVEWAEAPRNGTWYTVNGRRINFISDATPEAAMSSYDCYTTSPAFSSLEGAKETWRQYMRIGRLFRRNALQFSDEPRRVAKTGSGQSYET